MGQRLNIELVYDGKILLNSYYHWSGFTRDSIELTKTCLCEWSALRNMHNLNIESATQTAIHIIEATGSRINNDEFDRYNTEQHNIISAPFKEDVIKNLSFIRDGSVNRNTGL